MKKIYIAGKITGQEEKARQQFALATEQLSREFPHCRFINPMDLPHNHDKSWESYRKECITALMQCDTIYLLPGWQQSTDARLEFKLARALRYQLIDATMGDVTLSDLVHRFSYTDIAI